MLMQSFLIHASISRTLIYKFQSKISEVKVYSIQSFIISCIDGSYKTINHSCQINFQIGAKVRFS